MCSGLKPFDGEVLAHGGRNIAFAKHFKNVSVIGGVTNQCDALMILRRGADEGHAADINIFDGIGIGDVGFGNGLFKGIEVDSDEVNVIPAEVQQLLVVSIRGTG